MEVEGEGGKETEEKDDKKIRGQWRKGRWREREGRDGEEKRRKRRREFKGMKQKRVGKGWGRGGGKIDGRGGVVARRRRGKFLINQISQALPLHTWNNKGQINPEPILYPNLTLTFPLSFLSDTWLSLSPRLTVWCWSGVSSVSPVYSYKDWTGNMSLNRHSQLYVRSVQLLMLQMPAQSISCE